jgi:hypothetical protein
MATIIERHDPARKAVPEQQARQAVKLGEMRYVLAASITLAVVAGVFLYLAFFY